VPRRHRPDELFADSFNHALGVIELVEQILQLSWGEFRVRHEGA
jgi:hypothetical protein